jgi:hypothetical protein
LEKISEKMKNQISEINVGSDFDQILDSRRSSGQCKFQHKSPHTESTEKDVGAFSKRLNIKA